MSTKKTVAKKSKSVSRREKIQKEKEPEAMTEQEVDTVIATLKDVASRKRKGLCILMADRVDSDAKELYIFAGKDTRLNYGMAVVMSAIDELGIPMESLVAASLFKNRR